MISIVSNPVFQSPRTSFKGGTISLPTLTKVMPETFPTTIVSKGKKLADAFKKIITEFKQYRATQKAQQKEALERQKIHLEAYLLEQENLKTIRKNRNKDLLALKALFAEPHRNTATPKDKR